MILLISNLPKKADHADFLTLLSNLGLPKEKLKLTDGGQHLSVDFSGDIPAHVVDLLNGLSFQGSRLEARLGVTSQPAAGAPSNSLRSILIKNLPTDCSESRVAELLSGCGELLLVRLARGMAHVRVRLTLGPQALLRAIRAIDGSLFCGRRLSCQFVDSGTVVPKHERKKDLVWSKSESAGERRREGGVDERRKALIVYEEMFGEKSRRKATEPVEGAEPGAGEVAARVGEAYEAEITRSLPKMFPSSGAKGAEPGGFRLSAFVDIEAERQAGDAHEEEEEGEEKGKDEEPQQKKRQKQEAPELQALEEVPQLPMFTADTREAAEEFVRTEEDDDPAQKTELLSGWKKGEGEETQQRGGRGRGRGGRGGGKARQQQRGHHQQKQQRGPKKEIRKPKKK